MSDSEAESVVSESSSNPQHASKSSKTKQKGKGSISSVRRISSENFLVTITKLDEKEGTEFKLKAKEILSDRNVCYGFVIGQEKHRCPGKVHHHVFIHFEEKVKR